MSRSLFFHVLSLTLIAGLFSTLPASATAAQKQAPPRPKWVNIHLLSALIGPSKVHGSRWDGPGSASTTGVSLPRSTTLSASIIREVVNQAASGYAAPDVIGFVQEISADSDSNVQIALATRRHKVANSYTPRFKVDYLHWPIGPNTRFYIELWDSDLYQNDPIGSIELTYKDLQTALTANTAVWINVGEQSLDQLMAIKIAVTRASGSQRQKIHGLPWKKPK